ncbi:MAG TPA: GNAT family N-acetyltransferase [Vicinamibacterales bacterium]|nr:GNAT family N-acetyltransferase [Vicinamibacterales bacterium]
MEVIDFTPDLTADWSAFVGSHPLASYGHLAAQFALAAQTPGMRNVSLVVRDGSRICGVLPLFLTEHRALRRVPVRELVSAAFFPAGPLVSPKLQGKAEDRVVELLIGAARARALALRADRVVITHPNVVGGAPSIVRFGYSPLLHHGYKPRHGVGLLLDLTQPLEKLAAGRRSGCRQSVAKAQAAAEVSVMSDRSEWLACHDLNVQTLGHLAYSEGQMASIWDDFIAPGYATAYAVRAGGTIAAVVVTIQFNGSAYYWIGLNRRPAPVTGAGHLALWTAILAAQERGVRHFELGSLDFENPKNIGISQFKQSFGGAPYQIISAQLEARPVRIAALALGEALVAALRRPRQPEKPAAASSEKPAAPAATKASAPPPANDASARPSEGRPAKARIAGEPAGVA